jgi:hypothetical protein
MKKELKIKNKKNICQFIKMMNWVTRFYRGFKQHTHALLIAGAQ